jgi:hypothetical protein
MDASDLGDCVAKIAPNVIFGEFGVFKAETACIINRQKNF